MRVYEASTRISAEFGGIRDLSRHLSLNLYVHVMCCIHFTLGREKLQDNPSVWSKPPVDLDFRCSAILPMQWVVAVADYQLPEVSEISQLEVLTDQMGHPVAVDDELVASPAVYPLNVG